MTLRRRLNLLLLLLLGTVLLAYSSFAPGEQLQRVRAFSRPLEFDYVAWTLNATWIKFSQFALGTHNYLPPDTQRELVFDYLELVQIIRQTEVHIAEIYADPEITAPDAASAQVRAQLEELYRQRRDLGPLAESILQSQIRQIVAEFGLALGGQPIPPILYHSSPLPTALIVSPRHQISQEANISLLPGLTADERTALETRVDQGLNVSSLVVDIGGIGVYPTMVLQTSNLEFLAEVVAHEWIHNFLTLRPLGINYMASPELRTMNETAASIAGREIGRALLERYYPELVPPPAPPPPSGTSPEPEPEPPVFDFRAEMRETRLTVDDLLAEGKIVEAEAYMEARRVFFWEQGYLIRKLNQAYFAFYGAYADEPGGAAGEDPVGAAVRALRAYSPSVAVFLRRIAWLTSYEELQRVVDELSSSGDLSPSSRRRIDEYLKGLLPAYGVW